MQLRISDRSKENFSLTKHWTCNYRKLTQNNLIHRFKLKQLTNYQQSGTAIGFFQGNLFTFWWVKSKMRAFAKKRKREALRVSYLVIIGASTILGIIGSERCSGQGRIIRRCLERWFPVKTQRQTKGIVVSLPEANGRIAIFPQKFKMAAGCKEKRYVPYLKTRHDTFYVHSKRPNKGSLHLDSQESPEVPGWSAALSNRWDGTAELNWYWSDYRGPRQQSPQGWRWHWNPAGRP